MNANELTKYTIRLLNTIPGVEVWRNNNVSIRGRKFIGKRGVPDVIGQDKECKWIAVEIKVGNDKLSEDQKEFLLTINQKGGHAYVVTNQEDVQQIIQFLTDRK